MTIGEKVKKLREEKGMTQKQLCSSFMTRNMLSRIENGVAQPSIATLQHISKMLDIDAGYFVSASDDPYYFKKIGVTDKLKSLQAEGEYEKCLALSKSFPSPDGELALIFYTCALSIADQSFRKGDFSSAMDYYEKCRELSGFLPDLFSFSDISDHYINQCTKAFEGKLHEPSFPEGKGIFSSLHEEYLYLLLQKLIKTGKSELAAQLFDQLKLSQPIFRKHINACLSMSASNHERARSLLTEILEQLEKDNPNVLFTYTVYSDLEKSCKALGDYEGAYKNTIAKNELALSHGIRSIDE